VAIGIDQFALPHDSLAVALKEHRLHRNFQGYTTDDAAALLGFGASAIGGLPQGYVQNAAPLPGSTGRRSAEGGWRPRAASAFPRRTGCAGRSSSTQMCDFAVDLKGPASPLAAELEALEPFGPTASSRSRTG
jgi:oxygen-independent coproporphyrinogen-3 oxidase